jgi:hypothetical protein
VLDDETERTTRGRKGYTERVRGKTCRRNKGNLEIKGERRVWVFGDFLTKMK